MSNSLVRKSLDIVGADDELKRGKKKKNKALKSKGILNLIPANHRIDTKKDKRGAKIVISRVSKTTIEEAKLKLSKKTDKTEKNIERLLLLSSNRIDPETSDKLLNRALRKRYIPKDDKPEEEEKTVFTEADFKQFEEEYQME